MALSEELKKVYTNYNDTRMFYTTIQLYHPKFNIEYTYDIYPSNLRYPSETLYPSNIKYDLQSYFLVRDIDNHIFKLDDGSDQEFFSYPFNLIEPEVGSEQQDIGIVMDNVSLGLIEQIELAATDTTNPIELTYRVYIEGLDDPQMTSITLPITEVSVAGTNITCKASRVDLYKKKFPFGSLAYYGQQFPGLLV